MALMHSNVSFQVALHLEIATSAKVGVIVLALYKITELGLDDVRVINSARLNSLKYTPPSSPSWS